MQKKEIKALQKIWYKKLKKTGFEDIELGKPFAPETRTQTFKDREYVLEYFLRIDYYLTHNKDIKPLHRRILELYSAGRMQTMIAKEVKKSTSRIRQIIAEERWKISAFTLSLDN